LLAERGIEVAIVEEHPEIGHPTCCAGIVGAAGLRELGIKPGKWVLNQLTGARFYPPSGEPIALSRGRVEALVIDRAQFDRELAIGAARAGATFLMNTRCVGFGRNGSVKLRGPRGKTELKPRLVIGANGAGSLVAQEAGLLKTAKYLRCAQVETIADIDANTAELYFGRGLAPGFFAWVVPAGEVCRVGLGVSEGILLKRLQNFIKKHPIASEKIRSARILHLSTGLIPQPLTREIYADNLMLVGDAAGHVKPLTGGGIYLGLSCARFAAEVAVRSLEANDTSAKTLREYERLVQKKFGAEFKLGMRGRKLLEKLSDEELSSILKLLDNPEIKALVLEHADFDHHARLMGALVKKGPSLLKAIGMRKFLKYLRYFA
jgi:geranylgeranyl reductase family protein